ncbi:WD40 repeat domain-containing protein [Streptomyces vinaceus]|uniref:WD40 repeat domain-containing protein n=1 Tax=Streptomyces vinaceus TaxID=1960 RepID=UPI003674A36F
MVPNDITKGSRRARGRSQTLAALDSLDAALSSRRALPAPRAHAVRRLLLGDRGVLVPWLSRLVERRDEAALRRLYAQWSPVHDVLAAVTGPEIARPLAESLRDTSGLEVFTPRNQPVLHAVRIQAALALELVEGPPDTGRLATALCWYRAAGSTPDGPTAHWSPAALGTGDDRLRRALERLAHTAGDRADTGPTLVAAMALCRLALHRLPGPAREPVEVRVLFDHQGTGAAGRLTMTLLPAGPHGLVPDPETMALFTADASYASSLTGAWQASGQELSGTLLWSLQGVELAQSDTSDGTPTVRPAKARAAEPGGEPAAGTAAAGGAEGPRVPHAATAGTTAAPGSTDGTARGRGADAGARDDRARDDRARDDRGRAAKGSSLHRIAGGSLGAAFAVLLAETARVRQPALRRDNLLPWLATLWRRAFSNKRVMAVNAVTAGVTADGELVPVEGFRAKMRAARGVELVVVSESDGRQARGAAGELPDTGRPEIVAVPTVQRALRKARTRSRVAVFRQLVSLFVTVAVVVGVLGVFQWRNTEAEKVRKQARSLLNEAITVQESDPALALRLALSAHRMAPDDASRNGLLRILLESRYRGEIPAGPGEGPGPEAIGYTNDGRTFLTREADRITVWDTASRVAVATLPVPPGTNADQPWRDIPPVLLPLTAPGGSAVLLGTADHRAELWSFADPARPVRLAAVPGGQVLRAAVSGDGRTLATVGPTEPQSARDSGAATREALTVYDVQDPARPRKTGQLPEYPAGSETPLVGVTVSHSGNRVAVADTRTIRVHDAGAAGLPVLVTLDPGQSTGADDPRRGGQINPNSGVAFDGEADDILYTATTHPLAAGVGAGDRFVDVWSISSHDTDGYRLESTLQGSGTVVAAPHGSGAALDEAGVILLGSGIVLRTRTGLQSAPDPGRSAYAPAPLLAYSPDGTRLAIRGDDRTVRFWDVAARTRSAAAVPLTQYVTAAFAPGASVLAVTQLIVGTRHGEMETLLLDTATGPPYRRLAGLQAPADVVGVDRDATRLAVLQDGALSLWDVRDRGRPRRLAATFRLPADIAEGARGPGPSGRGTATGGITSLLVGPDGRTVIAVLAGSGQAVLWRVDGDGGRAAQPQRLMPGRAKPAVDEEAAPTATGWEPGAIPGDGAGPEEEAAPADSVLNATLAPAPAPSPEPSAPDTERGAVLSPDGRTLVVDTGRTGLDVWELAGSGPARKAVTITGATSRGRFVFSEDGRTLRAGAQGWRLDGRGSPAAAVRLPLPKGAVDMDVVTAGDWGALAVTSGYRDFTTWFVRPGMEPVDLGADAFAEAPQAFALQPGHLLLGYSQLVTRNVVPVVLAARDPRAAACAAVGAGLSRKELTDRAPGATWSPACPAA